LEDFVQYVREADELARTVQARADAASMQVIDETSQNFIEDASEEPANEQSGDEANPATSTKGEPAIVDYQEKQAQQAFEEAEQVRRRSGWNTKQMQNLCEVNLQKWEAIGTEHIIESQVDKSTELDSILAKRLARQRENCNGDAVTEDVGPLTDKGRKTDPHLPMLLAQNHSKREEENGIKDFGSHSEQSNKLHLLVVERPSQQHWRCEGGIAAEDAWSLAEDPIQAKRCSEQQNTCESGMGADGIGSVADERTETDALIAVPSFRIVRQARRNIATEGVGRVIAQSTELDPGRPSDVTEMDQKEGKEKHGAEAHAAAESDVGAEEAHEADKSDVDGGVLMARSTAHPISTCQSKLRWMWGDAGISPLPFSWLLAKRNPFRWSRMLNTRETIATFQGFFLTGEDRLGKACMRPVRLEVHRQGQSEVFVFTNVINALSHLSDSERSPENKLCKGLAQCECSF
jgi:hypothetical protein